LCDLTCCELHGYKGRKLIFAKKNKFWNQYNAISE
jgi:hypothetical protein